MDGKKLPYLPKVVLPEAALANVAPNPEADQTIGVLKVVPIVVLSKADCKLVGNKRRFGGVLGWFFITGLILLSLLSPNQGTYTKALSDGMWQLFGWGGIVVPLFVGGIGLFLIFWGMGQPPRLSQKRVTGGVVLFFTLEAFATILSVVSNNGLNTVWQVADAQLGGGLLGGLLAYLTTQIAGMLPAILLWLLVGLIGTVLLAGISQDDVKAVWTTLQERDGA